MNGGGEGGGLSQGAGTGDWPVGTFVYRNLNVY